MAEFLTDEEIDALLNIAELQEDSFVDKIEQFKNSLNKNELNSDVITSLKSLNEHINLILDINEKTSIQKVEESLKDFSEKFESLCSKVDNFDKKLKEVKDSIYIRF